MEGFGERAISFLGGESNGMLGRAWRNELNLTTGNGVAGSMSSIALNFGFHRKIIEGQNSASTIFLNRVWNSNATSFKNVLGDYVDEVDGKFYNYSSIDDMLDARHSRSISQIVNNNSMTDIQKQSALSKIKKPGKLAKGFQAAGGSLAVMGPLLNVLFAGYAGFSEWSRTGSLSKGLAAGGKDFVSGLVVGKIAGTALASSANFLLFGTAAAAGIGVYSVYNSKNVGNNYLKASRMSEWGGGVSPQAMSRPAFTMRQRAMQSMEFSKFNVMRALGNESLGAHTAKMRYANNSPVNILGY